MSAPTFVADYAVSDWQSLTSPKTHSVTVANGDVLAVLGGTADAAGTLNTPSGGGLTYSLKQSDSISAFTGIYGWTTLPGSGQTYTLSVAEGGTNVPFGFDALRFSGTAGVGASVKGHSASGTATVSITTTQANSAIVVLAMDWNAADGAARTWATVNSITPTAGNGLERVYSRNAANYTVYCAYYSDAGAIGAKTVGITAPTSLKYEIVAIEVLGTASGHNAAAQPVFNAGVTATLTKAAAPRQQLSSPSGKMPQVIVQAGFGAIGAGSFSWTDISAYVRSGNITRPVTRLAGPLYQYQPGTATVVLKNGDGRFDPDNLAGPYINSLALQQVQVVLSGSSWKAPSNLSTAGSLPIVELWAGGGGGGANNGATGGGHISGGGGGGGEYVAYNYALTAGTTYTISRGAAGSAGSGSGHNNGGNGGDTTFDAGALIAHGGTGGGAGGPVGGTAGTGGTGAHGGSPTSVQPGGDGGAGLLSGTSQTGGGGGGGSGAPGGTGSAGSAGTVGHFGAGGAGQTDGGPGGRGGGSSVSPFNGQAPSNGPGGGGGGGGGDGGTRSGGAGLRGQIRVTYNIAVVTGAFSEVLPMVPLRIQAVWNSITYNLFYGYATSWKDAGLNNPRYAEVSVDATDGMYVLQGVNLATLGSGVGSGEDTGARISRILDSAGWPDALRDLDDGDVHLQAATYGSSALDLIQVSAETEAGEFYIDGGGNAVFRRRSAILTDTRSTSVNAVLGDLPGTVQADGVELPYFGLIEVSDDTTLFNDIQATMAGGSNLQEVTDAPSISKFLFPRTYARSDLMFQSDSDTLNWAQYVLHIAIVVEDRFDTMTLMPQRAPTELFPQALGREVGDLIEVWRRPPGMAGFGKQCLVRAITHAFDASARTWETTWSLQNSDRFDFLILNDADKGRLDFNALG
jgi:hypothetical protein